MLDLSTACDAPVCLTVRLMRVIKACYYCTAYSWRSVPCLHVICLCVSVPLGGCSYCAAVMAWFTLYVCQSTWLTPPTQLIVWGTISLPQCLSYRRFIRSFLSCIYCGMNSHYIDIKTLLLHVLACYSYLAPNILPFLLTTLGTFSVPLALCRIMCLTLC